jgi:hypothetical protein
MHTTLRGQPCRCSGAVLVCLTFLRHRPQLQQPTHPAPQEPRQQGHHQALLASAAAQSSPCRFLRHLALQGRTGQDTHNFC